MMIHDNLLLSIEFVHILFGRYQHHAFYHTSSFPYCSIKKRFCCSISRRSSSSVGMYAIYLDAKSCSLLCNTEYLAMVVSVSVHRSTPIVGLSEESFISVHTYPVAQHRHVLLYVFSIQTEQTFSSCNYKIPSRCRNHRFLSLCVFVSPQKRIHDLIP